MNFILIDGEIYLATEFRCTRNVESTTSTSSNSFKTYTSVSGVTISGEMNLFHSDSLPEFQNSNNTPRTLRIQFGRNNKLYTIVDALFTSYKLLFSYDCAAASVEFTADSVEVQGPEDINTHISNE